MLKFLMMADKGTGTGAPAGGSSSSTTAADAAKKDQTPRVDAVRHDIAIFARVNSSDFATVEAQGKTVAAALKVLTDAGLVVRHESKFSREPETMFPKK